MKVELIPVIDIVYNNQDIPEPDKHPLCEYPELWSIYISDCHKKAGFKDELKPYLPSYPLYRLSEITDTNLTKLAIDHTQGMRDGKYKRPQDTCAFFGGYVLRVDGQDKYFPQCCGELSDIHYWESLADGKYSYYEGHPSPKIKFEGNNVVFDFFVDKFDEPFRPTPAEIILSVDRYELKRAIEEVKIELREFEQRLERINQVQKLNIDNIGGLLIWENANFE